MMRQLMLAGIELLQQLAASSELRAAAGLQARRYDGQRPDRTNSLLRSAHYVRSDNDTVLDIRGS